MLRKCNGGIAQLGEHLPYKQRVTGSIPVVPTIMRNAEVVLKTAFAGLFI